MRKYGLYLLIAMSLMTGCQKKDIVTVDTAAETTQESGETGSTAEREPESAVESISALIKMGIRARMPGRIALPDPYRGKRGI